MVERQRARRANWAFVAFVALFGGLLVLFVAPAQGAPPPTFSIDDVEVVEGDTGTVDAVFTVSASATTGRSVTFEFTTANGSATAGEDYQATSGTLTFGRHQQSATIVVPVLGDVLDEPDETFTVILSTDQRGVFITDGVGVGTIIDDDEPQADLVVTKTADRAAVLVGDTVSFLITVANDGPEAAQSVTLTDAVPSEFEVGFVGADGVICDTDGNTVSCSTASLASGGLASVHIMAQAVSAGDTTNTVSVSSDTADPDTSNNTSSADVTISSPPQPQADLVVTKFVDPSSTTVGQFVTFLIVVDNAGPDAAQSVMLTDEVPPEFEVSGPVVGGGMSCAAEGNTVTCSTASLASGASEVVFFSAQAVSAGTPTNTATVSSETIDPDTANNSSSVPTTVTGSGADLVAHVDLTAVSPTEVVITTTVTNVGPDSVAATDVTFTITQDQGVVGMDPLVPSGTATGASCGGLVGNPFTPGTWGGSCTDVVMAPGQFIRTVFHVFYATPPTLTARSEGFDRVVVDPDTSNNIDTESSGP